MSAFLNLLHAVIFPSSVLEGKRKRTSHPTDTSLNSHNSSSAESESESDEKPKRRKPNRPSKRKRAQRKKRELKEKENDVSSKQRYFFLSHLHAYVTTHMHLKCVL